MQFPSHLLFLFRPFLSSSRSQAAHTHHLLTPETFCCPLPGPRHPATPTHPPTHPPTPGAVKTLHLYEAKYLALLEEVLASDTKLFAHVVVELSQRPRGTSAATFPGAFVGENFVLLMATVVKVGGWVCAGRGWAQL
jgi:hypothetical protein